MKNIHYYLFAIAILHWSCSASNSSKENVDDAPSSISQQTDTVAIAFPDVLKNGLDTHGGIEKWNTYRTVSYQLESDGNNQTHFVDLHSRKLRITDSLFVLGYDGDQVWVSPDLSSFSRGSARFYHNLYFYFFAIPYILTDPGINYEDLGQSTIDSITYNAVKISYDQGVGDSPEDFYIAHFNTETGLMDVLLYTVTYFSKESSDKYGALTYEWQDVNGLYVPKSITGYKYDSGKLGDLRYKRSFTNVAFSKNVPADSLFIMPEIAEIDSLK